MKIVAESFFGNSELFAGNVTKHRPIKKELIPQNESRTLPISSYVLNIFSPKQQVLQELVECVFFQTPRAFAKITDLCWEWHLHTKRGTGKFYIYHTNLFTFTQKTNRQGCTVQQLMRVDEAQWLEDLIGFIEELGLFRCWDSYGRWDVSNIGESQTSGQNTRVPAGLGGHATPVSRELFGPEKLVVKPQSACFECF